MLSVRRALALSFSERYVLIFISLVGNVILARLLTPQQIGIYSVCLAIIGIAQVMREFGIGNFLIQEKDLTDAHISTAFGITLLIGCLMFVLVFMAAPFAGSFYGEATLTRTMRISALNFLTLPFCTISLALLRRQMAFTQLIAVTLTAAVISFAATLWLAYLGYGADSMAIGSVVGNIVTGAGAWIARTDRKLILPGFSEWRSVSSFGAQSSLANIVTSISMDINDLVAGKILGLAPVAILSRAQGLMNLFHRDLMAAVRNVALPAFSKAHREGDAIEPRHVASVTAITVFAWPFYGFVTLYALEVLRLMFGDQWDAAAPLVPLYCLAGAIQATANLILQAIMAVGRNDLVMKAELIFQPIRALLIVAAAVIFKSLMACAIAYLVAAFIYVPLVYAVKQYCIPTDFARLRANLLKSLQVSLATLFLPALLAFSEGFSRDKPAGIALLLMAAAAALLSWIAALVIFKHPVTLDPSFLRIQNRVAKLLRSPS